MVERGAHTSLGRIYTEKDKRRDMCPSHAFQVHNGYTTAVNFEKVEDN